MRIENPEQFTLIHKKSGIRISTYNCDVIDYDEEKFDKILPKNKQEKLF